MGVEGGGSATVALDSLEEAVLANPLSQESSEPRRGLKCKAHASRITSGDSHLSLEGDSLRGTSHRSQGDEAYIATMSLKDGSLVFTGRLGTLLP